MKDSIQLKILEDHMDDQFEVLWVPIRPTRLSAKRACPIQLCLTTSTIVCR